MRKFGFIKLINELTTRPGLLEVWLVLISVKYHGNLNRNLMADISGVSPSSVYFEN